jgi:acyl-[acyl-carrier-protein] desaturase
MNHLESFASKVIPQFILKDEEYWQPADYVPDMSQPDALEQVRNLQEGAEGLSDDLLVVLIGDMITEEALPSYAMWIQQIDGMDNNGSAKNAWGAWLRSWVAEENRHGDLLNRYLYLTGRVNMRAIEETIHNLIKDSADIGTGTDAYKTFIYTSFQEIATRVSHNNAGKLATQMGDKVLGRICGKIAGDEQRHAMAYKTFFHKILEVDPNNGLIAFYEMMRRKITMPAMYMREQGKDKGETFTKFSEVAERLKVYTPVDYTDIMEHLNKYWDIASLKGLNDKAEAAQHYLCSLPERYRKIADRFADKMSQAPAKTEKHSFSWLEMVEAEPKPLAGMV